MTAPAAMTDDSLLPFSFPAVGAKKVTAAFDGGRLSSDGGVCCFLLPSGVSGCGTVGAALS